MRLFNLGGYYFDSNNVRVQLPFIKSPNINEIEEYLYQLENRNGVVSLSTEVSYDKPYEITLYSDNKIYLILLSTETEDDIEVRTFNDNSGSREFIPILGEPYAKASTITNFSYILKVFKEFYETGDVNRELLG